MEAITALSRFYLTNSGLNYSSVVPIFHDCSLSPIPLLLWRAINLNSFVHYFMLLATRSFPVKSEELDLPPFFSIPDFFIEYTYYTVPGLSSFLFYKLLVLVITN